MKINNLFNVINDNIRGKKRREQYYEVVRSIIYNRKNWGLDNNVIDVYENQDTVLRELAEDFDDVPDVLAHIFSFPDVNNFLATNGYLELSTEGSTVDDDDDDDVEYESSGSDNEQLVYKPCVVVCTSHFTDLLVVANLVVSSVALFKLMNP